MRGSGDRKSRPGRELLDVHVQARAIGAVTGCLHIDWIVGVSRLLEVQYRPVGEGRKLDDHRYFSGVDVASYDVPFCHSPQ